MNEPRKGVSLYSIFDYWKDRLITPSGKTVQYESPEWDALSEEEQRGAEDIVLDWGEVECWACRKYCKDAEKVLREAHKKYDDEKKVLRHLWDSGTVKHFYERCHITPRSLGGSDEPENLFLLCPECHSVSPDTTNREAFFRWVRTYRLTHRNGWHNEVILFQMVNDELRGRGVPTIIEMLSIADKLNEHKRWEIDLYEEWNAFSNGKLGLHGTKLAESSAIISFADFFEAKYNEMINDF